MITATETIQSRWIGSKLKRKEDPRFLTGRGNYIDDIRLSRMLHAAILRSPYSHAEIINVEVEKVLRIKGVSGVVTGKEVANLTQPFRQSVARPGSKVMDYCMAVGKSRFVGEPVAAVAAESKYVAEDAIEAIEVEYREVDPVSDSERAMGAESPLVHEEAETNVLFHKHFRFGSYEDISQEADFVIKERFHFNRFSTVPLETNAIIANYEKSTGNLTIWTNNNMPMFMLSDIALALKIPSNKIRIISPDSGGSFGIKINNYPYMVLIALLSIKTGLPVKWIEDRSEHMKAAGHANERIFYAEIAAKNDGLVLGLRVRSIDDEGAYLRYEPAGLVLPIDIAGGCYQIRAIDLDSYGVVTNKCPVAPNRGYGRMQHFFMLERMIDLVAARIGKDPAQVRMKNYIRTNQMPYKTPSGSVYDGGDYERALKIAKRMIDFDQFRERQADLWKKRRYIGVGIANALDSAATNFARAKLINPNARSSGASEAATIRIDELGHITVILGPQSSGQGYETTCSIVVAEEFDTSPDQVETSQLFDSLSNPYTSQTGSYASRFVDMGVGAILGATSKIKNKLLGIASHTLDVPMRDLEFRNGRVCLKGSENGMSLSELANLAYRNVSELPLGMEPGLVETFFYRADFDLPDDDKGNFMLTYAYQTHAATVEVDVETGAIKVLKYVIVDDCGRMINPLTVEGQIHGSAAQGIGASLFEELKYDASGNLLSSTFMDYLAPTACELPQLEIEHLESRSFRTAYGQKGMGEGGGAPTAAIANAVEDALRPMGVKILDSHITPKKLFSLMKERNHGGPHPE